MPPKLDEIIFEALKEANEFGKQVEDKNKELKKEEKKELINIKKLKIDASDLKRQRNLGSFFYSELTSLSKKYIEKGKKEKTKIIINEFKNSFEELKQKLKEKKKYFTLSYPKINTIPGFLKFIKNLAIYGAIFYFFRKEIISRC